MAYCALSDLENMVASTLLIELTDDESAGTVNSARIAQAIADADAVVDGHLRVRYSVPLATPVPALIKKLSADLSLFNLFSRRGAHFELPQWVRDKNKAAMDMLKAMRDGNMDVGTEPPPASSSAQVATYSGPERLFTADTMKDF